MKKIMVLLMVLSILVISLSSCGMGSVEDLKKDIASNENPESEIEDSVGSESNSLSDSYESYQFMLFDEVYDLPISYTDFIAKGWTTTDPDDTAISSNDYVYVTFVKNNVEIECTVKNFDVADKPCSECYITEVEYEYEITNATDFILPGFIKVNESTYDDVVNAYGDSGELFDGLYSLSLDFESSNDLKSIELDFDTETKILTTATVRNETVPADYVISDVNPDSFINYTAPKILGTNISDKIFSYDGKLYELPCPLSEFLNNGWELSDHANENDIVGSGERKGVSLTYKDDFRQTDYSTTDYDKALFNASLSVAVYNYANDARLLKNCGICYISFDSYNGNYEELANRIGYTYDLSSKENFEKDIKDAGVKFNTSNTSYGDQIVETFKYDDYDTITVNGETLKVSYAVTIQFTDGMLSRFFISFS